MKFLHGLFLRLAVDVVALPAVRMARTHAALLATFIILVSGFPGLLAHADSKSAAEFTLKTCSDAMEDFAKVEAAARGGGWSSQPLSQAINKYVRNRSIWTVPQDEGNYLVSIWESLIGEEQGRPPQKVCAVNFRSRTVTRDELFGVMSAAMDLTFASDTRTPQIRTERYEINRYRPKSIHITFSSSLDGVVRTVLVQEMLKFDVPRVRPVEPPNVDR
jgi:hypothetical protein